MTATAPKADNGSAMLWILMWIAGLAIIGWATVTLAMPRFEQKQRSAVIRTVANVSKSPISMGIKGFTATLSGQVPDEHSKQAILSSIGLHTGILNVRDRLSVDAPSNEQPGIESWVPIAASLSADEATPIPLRHTEIEQPADSTTALAAPPEIVDVDTATSLASNPDSDTSANPLSNPDEKLDNKALPSLYVWVAGNIVAIDGLLSPEDNPTPLIQIAMDTFDVEEVSNGIEFEATTALSEWLPSVREILPLMGSLQEPELEIVERQITLSGTAPDRQIHDAIITEALSQLGAYSLVERITIAQTPQLAEAEPESPADDSKKAEVQSDIEAAAPDSSTAQLPALESDETTEANATGQTDDQLDTPIEGETVVEETKPSIDPDTLTLAELKEQSETEVQAEPQVQFEETQDISAEATPTAPAPIENAVVEPAAEQTAALSDPATNQEPAVEPAEPPETAVDADAPLDSDLDEDAPIEPVEQSGSNTEPEQVENNTFTVESDPEIETEIESPKIQLAESLRQALAELSSERVLFESDSDVLAQESLEVLNKVADVLSRFPDTTVTIEGHTDSTGNSETNLALSLARAATVRGYLVERGVSIFNLRAKGFGEEIPIASNQTVDGRSINRRIEFKF